MKLECPIAKLPFELLAYIFEYLATYPPGNLQWTSVMLVCHRWHKVAIDTPKLWTTIACSDRLEDRWVLPLLKRSQDLPLFISLNGEGAPYKPSHYFRNTFHKVVTVLVENQTDMRRLQNIHIDAHRPHDTFTVARCLDKFRLPAPALRVFHLDSIPYKAALSADLFGGVTPSLRELTLNTRLGLSPIHPLLRDLTCLHLEFRTSDDRYTWSVEETLAVLATCPSLTSLALFGVLRDTPNNSSGYPVDTITLPLRLFVFNAPETALRRLTDRLASSRPTVIDGTILKNRSMLDFISPNFSPIAPNEPLSTLFLSLTSDGDRIIGYPATFDPSLDLRQSHSFFAKDGKCEVRDFDDELDSKHSSTDTNPRLFLFDLLLYHSNVDVPELVHYFTHSQEHTVRSLFIKVKWTPRAVVENTWRRLFESMPQVERLSIRAKDRHMDPVLAALRPQQACTSNSSRSGADGVSVLLPNLRTLELEQAWLDEEIGEEREPGTALLEDGESVRRLLEIIKARKNHSAPIPTLFVEGKEVSKSDMRTLLRVELD